MHAAACPAQSQLTNLPTLYITTDDNRVIDSKENYVPGSLKIVGEAGAPGLYDGRIEIRGRGNSTWLAPKKPYRIKLASRFRLLGMPSNARNWALLANYFDDTLIRNALAFEISRFFGFEYTCAYRFVDVYLNGNYIGNYLLTDHVQVENNRVVVDELEDTDTELPVISGGYFIQEELYAEEEEGYFQTGHAHRYAVKYPDTEDINQQQWDYITGYIGDFENRLFSGNFLDPVAGYNPVMDRASQVNWQIANELTGNPDAYLSVYLFKKRNDPRLYFGPVWDNDIGFNNTDRFADMKWLNMWEVAYNNSKIKQMLLDPGFSEALKSRWKALRAAGLYEHLDSKIVELSQRVMASQALNFQLPDITKSPVSPDPFETRITKLRTYLKKRIAFLDYQLTGEIESDRYYKIAGTNARQAIAPRSDADLSVAPEEEDDTDLLQEWTIVPDGSGEAGFYKIRNRKNGFLLTQDGSNVRVSAEQAESFNLQRWKIEKLPDQPYATILTPVSPEQKALAHEGGAITLSTNLSNFPTSGSRRWFFVPTDVSGSALPVVLSGFRVTGREEAVELRWDVTEASNFDYFEVERTASVRDSRGTPIGRVYLDDRAAGSYVFVDSVPGIGINYYRLKLVDKDGTYSYTRYLSTEYTGIASFSAYPVPAHTELNVTFKSAVYKGGGTAQLLNSLGNPVARKSLDISPGGNRFGLEVKNLPPGLYLLQISFSDRSVVKRVAIAD